jgi:xylulokinase
MDGQSVLLKFWCVCHYCAILNKIMVLTRAKRLWTKTSILHKLSSRHGKPRFVGISTTTAANQMKAYSLGLDVGTGGTRAVLVGNDGGIVSSATREHQPFVSPHEGWAEQDPHDWWRAAADAVRDCITKAQLGGQDIGCVGLAGQMHGAVLLDENDQVLRPAIIWCDQRTQQECDWLDGLLGRERLVQLTCNPALTNFTLTKLLWVRNHEPRVWQRFRKFLLPKDYVRFRLSCEYATDMADASGTLMLDVARRRWSSELMAAVGLPESCLPRVFESAEICARVSDEGARATGLRPGTPVIAGTGDQAGGAVGLGIVRPGDVSATIGTSGVVFAATDRPAMDPQGRVHTFCHAVPDRWHVMGVTQAAGLSLRWFRDLLAGSPNHQKSYDELIAEAAATPAGADGLLWAPYLMGERTPHLDPRARGALVGLSANHTRSHVVRAILEGVAFSLKDTLALFDEMKVPVRSIRLGGGGARSTLWRQIQADIYGHEVEIVEAEEGAAYGAALLAAVADGVWESVEEACECGVHIASRIQPNPAAVIVTRLQYEIYRALYPALKPVFAKLTNNPSREMPK